MMLQDFNFYSSDIALNPLFWIFFILTIVLSAIGLIYVIWLLKRIEKLDSGSEEMVKIHNFIRIGARSYLRRQYKTVIIVLVIIFIIFLVISIPMAVSFAIGAICSIIASYISMISSTLANVRVTQASKKSVNSALKIGYNSGLIIGVSVISISLLGISILYIFYNYTIANIIGFGFGASFAALFAQLGGGIFTKGADIGADIVGKLEKGLPEDDYRNPAAIADNVGDNVGDCAGRGADLFESSSANNLGAMVIGVTLSIVTGNPIFIIFSLVSRAIGNFATMIGSYFIKMKDENSDPMKAFGRGLIITASIIILCFLILCVISFGDGWWLLFICAIFGIFMGLSSYFIVNYYTSSKFRPVKEVIRNSETGPATNVISGFALGLESTALPVVCYVLSIIVCFLIGQSYSEIAGIDPPFLGGVFGITVATIGLLSMTTIILAFDGFGPVADNAAGIAEMAHLGDDVRRNLDRLDAVGNTTKALAKGFGMTCAALSAVILYVAYLEETHLEDINIYNPIIMSVLFIGGVAPFLFSALAIRASGICAYSMIKEIKRQFMGDPGILEGTSLPDYAKAIDVATKVAQKQMILPSLISVATPILVGFIFGPIAIAAFLISGTISGILLGSVMNTGGGALDNAKKAIEDGLLGGKGSPAHAAAVVGDTFGDPLKDTAGPSLHIFIKVINTISITFAPLFILYGGLLGV
ncbi:MAG: sodium-translocating pyrophosphatase [Promethearchaeota archaeon]